MLLWCCTGRLEAGFARVESYEVPEAREAIPPTNQRQDPRRENNDPYSPEPLEQSIRTVSYARFHGSEVGRDGRLGG